MNKTKKVKNKIEFIYEINAGIPFKWQYQIENKEIVTFVKSYISRNDNKGAIVGASVYTNYVFKALKPGTTTIIFKLINFTEKNRAVKEEKHTIKVDNNLNIEKITSK